MNIIILRKETLSLNRNGEAALIGVAAQWLVQMTIACRQVAHLLPLPLVQSPHGARLGVRAAAGVGVILTLVFGRSRGWLLAGELCLNFRG